MDEKPVLLTKEGLKQLEEELHLLVTVRRPEVAERIRHARDFGDISENAEYTEAKNEQSLVEGRIQTLEGMIRNAAVIEEEPREKGVVSVGAMVEVSSDEGAETYSIVGAAEDTVLAFLSSGCHSCQHFWDTIGDGDAPGLPAGARVVIVTKDPADESLSKVRALATGRGPVVMSTAAWVAYEVPVAPYFLYVHGASGRVLGEGAAGRWEQVMSLLGQAIDDAGLAPAADDGTRARRAARRNWLRRADAEREARVDADLEGAGIRPGDPSLHPPAVVDD